MPHTAQPTPGTEHGQHFRGELPERRGQSLSVLGLLLKGIFCSVSWTLGSEASYLLRLPGSVREPLACSQDGERSSGSRGSVLATHLPFPGHKEPGHGQGLWG